MSDVNNVQATEQLITTKLYIPPWRAEQVARPQLVAHLHVGREHPLTLICAPAGSGKTTLLSEWLATTSSAAPATNTTAWLSLDQADNDLVRFWRYIIAALNTIHPIVDEHIVDLLKSPQSSSHAPFLSMFINTILSTTRDILLILDDYHVIHTQAIHDTLTFLLEHMPPNMHLFIASRTDPPLPLARLRARRQLIELRTPDLRFTHDEILTFLRYTLNEPLPAADVIALENRTEGWIVGLQLAVLSMKGLPNHSDFIAGFTGNHRYIIDYLVEEVLHRLPENTQTFLLFTSILDRLSAPLCNALLERSDSQNILEELEQANIFLIPLDDERHWYRYHHLFADVLQHRLQHLQPEVLPVLHNRASMWYEQQGQKMAAIEHALSAHNFTRAASLIKQMTAEIMLYGNFTTLLRWLERFPDHIIRSHINLCLNYAWMLLTFERFDEAEQRLQDAEYLLQEMESQDEFSFENLMSNIMSCRAAIASNKGNTLVAIQLGQQALNRIDANDFMRRSFMTLHLAMAY